jgi:hypothetical protein
VDFYNEVSILYELCAMDAEARFQHPGDGFPPNFEYRWADAKNPKPIRCTSGEYVSHVLSVSLEFAPCAALALCVFRGADVSLTNPTVVLR